MKKRYGVRWAAKGDGERIVTLTDPDIHCVNWHHPEFFLQHVLGQQWYGGRPYPIRGYYSLEWEGNPGEGGVWKGRLDHYPFVVRDLDFGAVEVAEPPAM